ncbi:MAG: hypothetical protein JWR40_89 [Massilia sp.]|jgi:hypothetical protein|nr:hypothetical protein [Massilia sp.]
MLQQILTHTPAYVWAILAFLVYRGVIASTDREVAPGKLFIIPAVMLALSLQDLAGKFGLSGVSMAAWAGGAAVGFGLAWKLGAARVVARTRAGTVMLRGSWLPLGLMMAVFCTKYVAAVLFALHPQARRDVLLVVAVAALFGVLNGVFLGRLARDMTDGRDGADARLPARMA